MGGMISKPVANVSITFEDGTVVDRMASEMAIDGEKISLERIRRITVRR